MCRVIVDVCNPSAENALQYGFITCVSSSFESGPSLKFGTFIFVRNCSRCPRLFPLAVIRVHSSKIGEKNAGKSSDNKPRDSVTKSSPVHTHTWKNFSKALIVLSFPSTSFFLGVSAPLCQFRIRINLGCWPGYQGTAIPITARTIFYANNSSFY